MNATCNAEVRNHHFSFFLHSLQANNKFWCQSYLHSYLINLTCFCNASIPSSEISFNPRLSLFRMTSQLWARIWNWKFGRLNRNGDWLYDNLNRATNNDITIKVIKTDLTECIVSFILAHGKWVMTNIPIMWQMCLNTFTLIFLSVFKTRITT